MLEKNQRIKSLLYLLLDAALLFIGFLLANYIRFNFVRFFEPGGAGPGLAVARDPRNILAGLGTSLVLGRGHLLQRPPARSGGALHQNCRYQRSRHHDLCRRALPDAP